MAGRKKSGETTWTVYVVWERPYGEDSRTRSLPFIVGAYASKSKAIRMKNSAPTGFYREIHEAEFVPASRSRKLRGNGSEIRFVGETDP